MSDENKIPVTYVMDQKTGDIHRKMGKGNEIIEDVIVANYKVATKVLTFPNQQARLKYYEGVIVFLASNEWTVRYFQRADLKPDKAIDDKNVPARPKKQDINGDKTPAIVDWYLKYRWNEFCTRYGYLGKYTGLVRYLNPVWVPRPNDGLPEYRGTEKLEKMVIDAIVTSQKTHRSFLPSECVEWSEDESEQPESVDGAALAARALAGNTVDEEMNSR